MLVGRSKRTNCIANTSSSNLQRWNKMASSRLCTENITHNRMDTQLPDHLIATLYKDLLLDWELNLKQKELGWRYIKCKAAIDNEKIHLEVCPAKEVETRTRRLKRLINTNYIVCAEKRSIARDALYHLRNSFAHAGVICIEHNNRRSELLFKSKINSVIIMEARLHSSKLPAILRLLKLAAPCDV